MRSMLFVATLAVAAALWLPGEAAQPAAGATADDPITFAQYRDWRNRFNERRLSELAIALAASDLPEERKARLERTKTYYDGLTGLTDAERDRRYRARFDRIDTDHDGTIDRAERAAWRAQRRTFYSRRSTAHQPAPATQ